MDLFSYKKQQNSDTILHYSPYLRFLELTKLRETESTKKHRGQGEEDEFGDEKP